MIPPNPPLKGGKKKSPSPFPERSRRGRGVGVRVNKSDLTQSVGLKSAGWGDTHVNCFQQIRFNPIGRVFVSESLYHKGSRLSIDTIVILTQNTKFAQGKKVSQTLIWQSIDTMSRKIGLSAFWFIVSILSLFYLVNIGLPQIIKKNKRRKPLVN